MASEERLAQRILPPIFTPYTHTGNSLEICASLGIDTNQLICKLQLMLAKIH